MRLPSLRRPGQGLPAREAYVAVRMGNPIFYRVAPDGIREVGEGDLPPLERIVAFDEFDARAESGGPAGEAAARRIMARAAGERLWIVNRSRDLGAVYGRSPARIKEFGRAVVPGAELADLIAAGRGIERRNAIVGFDLGTSPRLVILYGYRGDGELCPPQFAADPHDVELFVAEYVRMNGVDPAGPATLASVEDLLQALGGASAYPLEESVLGIPRSKAYALASGIGFAGALIALAHAAMDWRAAAAANEAAQAMETETARLNAEVAARAAEAIEGLAARSSLDIDRLLGLAGSAWSPGARVSVEAGSGDIVLSARLGGDEAPAVAHVREALERGVPAGLERAKVLVDRRLNGIVIQYRAPGALGPLGARARE